MEVKNEASIRLLRSVLSSLQMEMMNKLKSGNVEDIDALHDVYIEVVDLMTTKMNNLKSAA
ncbi:hypothetical protein A3K86_19635 [Photobacterium jeanii]|uniref:Uncharacterized protein n=1 Tax=Photobacterium jeanii TaxID=858640 RepID=A0A178K2J7_9GAMM|nr:hypothetical protein [Photobacterium jeanii]OAN11175.1 hypothetical protein A3K86_19635 [Photobacterium jeanii]PST90694.1 hypothetical protein C9I91_08735 [Photobacterium jeanii]